MKKFPTILSEEEKEAIITYLEERFGFPKDLWINYEMLKGASNYWLYPKNVYWTKLASFNPETVGLLFLRRVSEYLKPTSAFLQRFGPRANKNMVDLSKKMFESLRKTKKIEYSSDLEPGYVILRYEGWILGCGLYLPPYLFAYLEEKILNSV